MPTLDLLNRNQALERGMQEKAAEFVKTGAEIYRRS
jgi:hypothetical protein